MIAKRIRKNGTSSPSRLVRYMVAVQGGLDPCNWKRTADYILDSKSTTTQGEKVSSYRVTNYGTDDPVDALTLIELTRAFNQKAVTPAFIRAEPYPSLTSKLSAFKCVSRFNICMLRRPVMEATSIGWNPFSKSLEAASWRRSCHRSIKKSEQHDCADRPTPTAG